MEYRFDGRKGYANQTLYINLLIIPLSQTGYTEMKDILWVAEVLGFGCGMQFLGYKWNDPENEIVFSGPRRHHSVIQVGNH